MELFLTLDKKDIICNQLGNSIVINLGVAKISLTLDAAKELRNDINHLVKVIENEQNTQKGQ